MKYFILILTLSACAHIDRPTTSLGDWGRGTPTTSEIHQCQDLAGGEMIFNPTTDTWKCES